MLALYLCDILNASKCFEVPLMGQFINKDCKVGASAVCFCLIVFSKTNKEKMSMVNLCKWDKCKFQDFKEDRKMLIPISMNSLGKNKTVSSYV